MGERLAEVSLDLGRTAAEAVVVREGVRLPGGELVPWATIEAIAASENGCFVVETGEAERIGVFSELTNRAYTLMPTTGAPTMLVSGIPMHRIKGTDPYQDTLEKIQTIRPIRGQVLDTATGLGYTAIETAQSAERVITVELDPAVLEIARLNPWSRGLFENPRIRQLVGDSFDVVQEFEDGQFARIIHDPPALPLAGRLYAGEFYAQLFRVLRRGGRLFHYVGNPESKSARSVTRGVVLRLQEAGFTGIARRPRAFGLVARK